MLRSLSILMLLVSCFFAPVNAGWFSPDNYGECLLKKMQNVHSDTIARQIVDACKNQYPPHERIFATKKAPWCGPKTSSECVVKYAKKLQAELGVEYIQSACYKLYPVE